MGSKTALKTREKGTGCIYKSRKRFYLKIRINGRAKSVMLRNADDSPCTTIREAGKAAGGMRRILLAETMEETAHYVQEAKRLKKQSALEIDDAWETYLKQLSRPDSGPNTLSKYKSILSYFTEWMHSEYPRKTRVADVDREMALAFMQSVYNSGVSNTTYNKYLQSLRLIFKHLKEPAALDANPFEDIPKKPSVMTSRKEFTMEQVKAIFQGFETGFFYETVVEKLTKGRVRKRITKRLEYKPMFKEEMRVLLLLCCWTGCRGQDGCLMTWDCIDLENGLITYIPQKTARKTGYRKVTLPIKDELYEALLEAAKWRSENKKREDYILPKIADRYKRNPSGIQKDVMKIIRCATGVATTASKDRSHGQRKLAANVYSLHSFRHTFVSFCANAGVPLAVVAEIVGHGNPAMTEHYSHISTESKREAIKALPSICITVPQDDDVIDEPLSLRRKAIAEALETFDSSVLDEVEQLLKERELKRQGLLPAEYN